MNGKFNFPTLVAALDALSDGEHTLRFHDGSGKITSQLSYAELQAKAHSLAKRLCAMGLNKGNRIAVIAATSPEFLLVFYGCQYAGIIPCPLPYRSNLESPKTYTEKITTMLQAGSIKTIIALPKQSDLENIAEASCATLINYQNLLDGTLAPLPPAPLPEDIAYIQFSSGSTSHPKGVLISHRAVSANVDAILTYGLGLTSQDRAFSWLPFYHDMGLVGFSIAALYGQCPVDYLPALSFARRPVLWLRLMAAYGTTITYSPSFGYKLATQRYRSEPEPFDLSKLRIAGVGGDMIRADVLTEFTDALKETGFKESAFMPSYGMAEASLAISFGGLNTPFETDIINIQSVNQTTIVPLASNQEKQAKNVRNFVSCGYPLPNIDVQIVDEKDNILPEYHVGRIQIRGPNLMKGYIGDTSGSSAPFNEQGFFDTGDLGYQRRGQIVVTGRAKDLILFRGRNIWPEDIEWAAEKAAMLHHGDSIAFSIDVGSDDEKIILLVQTKQQSFEERTVLKSKLHQAIAQSCGISCEIVFVKTGSLPKTSSGKLSRSKAKELYVSAYFE